MQQSPAQGIGLNKNNKLIQFTLNNPNLVTEKNITGILGEKPFYNVRISTINGNISLS